MIMSTPGCISSDDLTQALAERMVGG